MSNRILDDYFKMPEGMSKQDIQEHINKQLSMERDNNLKQIKKEVEETLGGKFVTDGSEIYYLVGACATHEDYYYVCLDKRGNIRFLSCVGRLEIVDDVFKTDCSYLYNKIRTQERNSLINHIKNTIDKSEIDVLFTPIYIEKP